MIIQFNTDKTINGDEKSRVYFSQLIRDELRIYSSGLTRIEIHLSDENGKKEGPKDIRCLLEARIEGRQPIAVTSQENTEEQAVSKAIEKIKSAIKSTLHKSGSD